MQDVMFGATRREFVKGIGLSSAAGAALGSSAMATAAFADGIDGAATDAEGQPLKVKLVVCSPTGGTLNAGLILAHSLSDDVEVIDQTSYVSRQQELSFGSDDLVIMICSTIAGRMPMAKGLFTNLKGDNTPCIAAATFGNRDCEMTNALIAEIAASEGFNVIGGIAIVTDHVLGRFLGHGRPDLDDLAVIQDFADSIKEKIANGNLEPITIEGDPSCYENYNPEGTIYQSTTAKVYYPENCEQCGTCAQECTAGAIDPQTLEIDESICIHCQRCTYVCRHRGRYFFPESEFEQGDHYWSHKDLKVYL